MPLGDSQVVPSEVGAKRPGSRQDKKNPAAPTERLAGNKVRANERTKDDEKRENKKTQSQAIAVPLDSEILLIYDSSLSGPLDLYVRGFSCQRK